MAKINYKTRDADLTAASEEKNKYNGHAEGVKMEDRSCTDVFFCLFFFVFMNIMVAISIYAFIKGDPVKILTKYDSDGNMCGQPNQNASWLNTTTFLSGNRDFTNFTFKYYSNLD